MFNLKRVKKLLWCVFGLSVILLVMGLLELAWAQEAPAVSGASSSATGWAYFSAALATGLSAVGAGIAVGYVGAAAVGAISEKPEVAGRALIFVGLAEGIAIYGLIIAIMILGKV